VTSSLPNAPDDLERLFRRLVQNVADLDPSRLDGPIPLAEIHQNFVPYRTHRAVLAIETNQDYEMAVLRLLAGERGYARVEPDEIRTLLEREVRAVNPETGIFRRFPSAVVRLDPDQARVTLAAQAASGAPASPAASAAGAARPDAPPADAPPAAVAFQFDDGGTAAEGVGEQPELPFSLDDASEEPPEPEVRDATIGGAQCGYCGGDLPVGRSVIFCPHCGQNVGVMHCPVCGTELDVGWRFCITCGREAAGLG
jgi:hypothetical protein